MSFYILTKGPGVQSVLAVAAIGRVAELRVDDPAA